MAVGLPLKTTYANGDVYSASDVNDTNGTINITAAPYAAGKNKIINGNFGIWQRGTSFSTPGDGAYTADRMRVSYDGTIGTFTVSQQTFTPGTAPVSGYEGQYFYRWAQTAAGSGSTYRIITTRLEDVRTFAGQTITVSFWAKADTARNVQIQTGQNFGSGGSGSIFVLQGSAIALTTSWARYSVTFTVASVSGKTIGAGSYLELQLFLPLNTTMTMDFWGWQAENGSTATPFQTATGTIQGELAACQRYFYRALNANDAGSNPFVGFGQAYSSSAALIYVNYPVTLRGAPSLTASAGSNFAVTTSTYGVNAATTVGADQLGLRGSTLTFTGSSGLTAGNACGVRYLTSTGTIDFSAEL